MYTQEAHDDLEGWLARGERLYKEVICIQLGLPAMWETRVQSLSQDGPLQKEMATHSSILAWRIPWTVKLGGLQSMGLQRVRHD